MPAMPINIMIPKMPKPDAKLRIPDMYIATINPITPTIRTIGSTIPHTLRGGGIGAGIGGSIAILPPAVAGGRAIGPGRLNC